MSIFEYNEAEEKEKLRRAEYVIGYDDGMTKGIERSFLKSMTMLRGDSDRKRATLQI